MIFLYIIAGLLLLVALILMLRIRITVSYRNSDGCEGSPAVYLGIGPARIKLYPKKEEKLKLSDYSPKKYRRLMESTKSMPAAKGKTKKKKDGDTMLPGGVGETFELVTELVEKFTGHLRCEVFDLRISVGTGDAATTALSYAAVSSAVQFLLETVDNFTDLRVKHPRNVFVEPDFDGDGLLCDIRVRFSIRVLNVLRAGKGFILNYLRTMIRLDNQNKAK